MNEFVIFSISESQVIINIFIKYIKNLVLGKFNY